MIEVTSQTNKRKPLASLRVAVEERKRIQFHISSLRGLPPAGWRPFASTFISVENVEVRELHLTEYKKSAQLMVWDENIPVMNLKDSSKIRFEVRNRMPWNKSVLGKTELLDFQELLFKQREVGEDRDSYIEINIPLNSSSTPSSRFGSPKPATTPDFAILTLSIRELADKDKNLTLTASHFKQFFDSCQNEALKEVRDLFQIMSSFRQSMQESSFVCLVDILLGILKAVQKEITNPSTRNINKNTVAVLNSLNRAFLHYGTLSERQLSKMGEGSARLIKDMLYGVIRALAATEVCLKTKGRFESDKLEFKMTLWVPYFQHCEEYLSGNRADRPLVPASSRRIKFPPHIVAHPELSEIKFLPMYLPEPALNGDTQTARGDLVRLVSEWIFSSSFQLNASDSNSNSLNLAPNTTPQQTTNSNPNVFCLVDQTESSSDTLPTPQLVLWLNEMGYLGGYFSFTPPQNCPARTPQHTLDALPITLTHQACSVEADASKNFIDAFAKNPWGVKDGVEKRFQALFATPLREFVFGRPGYLWKPLDPMVIVLDCTHLLKTSSPTESHLELELDALGKGQPVVPKDAIKLEEDGRLALARLADWATSRVVRTLPAHVKLLILANKGTEVGGLLEKKGAFVYEVFPVASRMLSTSQCFPTLI